MSVLLETSLGDIVIDLLYQQAPLHCLNFISLCKLKYYNNCLFHSVQKNFIAETGDPAVNKKSLRVNRENNLILPSSVFGIVSKDSSKRYFKDEISDTRKFSGKGVVASANLG